METEYIVLLTTAATFLLFLLGVPIILCLGTWSMSGFDELSRDTRERSPLCTSTIGRSRS